MAQIDLLDSGLVGLPEIFNLLKKKKNTISVKQNTIKLGMSVSNFLILN